MPSNIPRTGAKREGAPLRASSSFFSRSLAAISALSALSLGRRPSAPPALHSGYDLIWRLLARASAAVHIAYVLFVVLGSLLVLRRPGLIWIHLLAVAWAVATLSFDLGCALTPLEKTFWRRGGREPYPEGFLQHHVLRYRFPPEKSRQYHLALGAGVLLLNAAVYALIMRGG